MATIKDISQKPAPILNPRDNTSTHPLTHPQPLPKNIPRERTLTPARTPQLVSLRQAYSTPWGINIPPHRPAALQSSSPSSSPPSSSPSSSFSSAFKLRHFKSLSRLSIFNLGNQPNQEDQADCHVRPGPELIEIPNRSLPSSLIGSNHKDSSPRGIEPRTDNLKTLLMVNIPKSSRDSPTRLNQPLDLNFKYPTSPSPAKSITTQSCAHMTSLVNLPSSQSIIPADLLPSLNRAQSSPRPIFSPLSLAGSPQLESEPSSSPFSSQSQLQVSSTPPSSPHTNSSSPSNCQTCRFPLSRASSQSSFLLGLSYRSPLFDDFEEEGAVSQTLESLNQEVSFNDERPQFSRQPSICSSSPDSSHPLSTWWSDLPPHRRAHIIEAESWPIFAPSAPLPILGSPLSGHCTCSSLPSCELSTSDDISPEQIKHSHDSSHHSSSTSYGSRPSLPTNLNLLIPTPLDQHETDPLLSANLSSIDSIISPTTSESALGKTDPYDTESTSQPTRKKKRRGEESTPRSSESLLTKSLRRLSRKLPNIQWGNLSVRMNSSSSMGGSKSGDDAAGEDGPGEEENALPSGVVDEDSSVELVGEDEKAQISRLVKSWTLDNIQPQNSLNGSFIVDPEMEWSSMMVQLETFSPDSNKKPHKLRTQTERKIPRSTRAEQYSRRSGGENGDSTGMGPMGPERRSSAEGGEERSESGPDEKPAKRSQSRKRLSRNQQQKQRGINNTHERKNSVKITRRVVSNPLHLLQLTLELEMMRQLKIKSPLKQRSMKLVLTKLPPTSQNNNEFEYIGSPLRFEI